MPWETVLFDLDNVLVTNRRFAVGRRSIPLHRIASLHCEEHARAWPPVVSSALMAVVACSLAITLGSVGLGFMAAALFTVATTMYLLDRPRYSIAVDTGDGRQVPLITGNRFLVAGVNKVLQSQLDRSRTASSAGARDQQPMAAPVWMFPARHASRKAEARRRHFHPGKTA